MAKQRQKAQAAREPLPPHLKPHSTPGMSRDADGNLKRCPGEWSKVYSEAGSHIGWHCACGRTEGMAPRPRKCPECGCRTAHDRGCDWTKKRAAALNKKADAIAVKATRRRGMEARARAKAEALRKEATALLGST